MARKKLAANRLGAGDGIGPILAELRGMANPRNVEGMARFGINPANTLGISNADLKPIAKRIGHDHRLALALWQTGVHEARILAFLIDERGELTEAQMDAWAADFDSWDICDGCCLHLFGDSPLAWKKAVEWSKRDEEYVKRAGYALMAVLAVHDKSAPDSKFIRLLPHIRRGSKDERNYVRKAVNWALRQIGKRNLALNRAAIATAKQILATDTKAARWIATDALKELRSDAVRKRLSKKAQRRPTRRTSARRT